MANTNLNVRMKHVVKTETEWNATTSKPLKGEICITDPSGRIKIGDGTNLWSALPYIDASNITALSNSGSTITYTKADGSTGTITLPSYSVATSSTPGLVKSGTDISVDSSGNVSVVDNSHNHTIANVTNLQTSLDAKAPKASPALTGTPTAPTATAGTNTTQIATTAFVQSAVNAINTVTGVKGNAESSYRTGNVNLTADNIGAIPKNTTGNTQQLVRPSYLNGLNDNTLDSKVNTLRANRLAFLPADQIIIEKTTDGGATWVDAGVSDAVKVGLFSETRAGVSIPLLNGVRSLSCGLRITFTAMKYNVPANTPETQKYNYWNSNYIKATERYNQLKEMYFWVSAVSDTIGIIVQRATGASSTSWSTIFDNSSYGMTGWSGNDYVRFSQGNFGGGTTQTSNFWNYRIILMTRGTIASNGQTLATTYTTSAQSINEIRGYGDTWWTAGNEYAANDKIYTHDYLQNVTFPNKINSKGGEYTGDVVLLSSSGDSPSLFFKRGTDTDNLSDWKIVDSSGNLNFSVRDNTLNNTWTQRLQIGQNGNITASTFTGNLSGTVNGYSIGKSVPSDAVFTDTTYSVATSSTPGLVKSGTDIAVDANGNVSVVDNSHSHTIANITDLQTTLDGKQTSITGGASTITSSNLTASRALISNSSGKVAVSDVTSTELGYLDGVTSNVQTQLGTKAPLASPALTGTPTAPTATAGTNTTQIATTAFVQNAIGNTEIGGRNLLYRKTKNGGKTKNAIDYGITLTGENADTYFALYLWEPLKQGEQYTISCEVEGLQEGTRYVFPLFGQGRSSLGTLILDHNGKCSGIYTHDDLVISTETVDNKIFYKLFMDDLGRTISSGQGDIILSHFKLEKGNKATDWSPAPEDLVSSLSLSGSTLAYNNINDMQLGTVSITKSTVGLDNVENKSSATIRGELTSSNVTTALGYTPVNKAGDTMTGNLFTKGSGETQVGVKYVSNSSEGNLYFWGNYSSGTRGVYDSKKGYVIQVSDSATTFTGNVTGNVSGKAGYTHEVRQIETYNFNSRATSANINSNNNGGLRVVLATNSMTATNGKPDYDSHIIHLDWDNSSTYASQLAVGNYGVNGRIAVRAQNADQTWTGWSYVYDTAHKPTANDVGALSLTGGTLTGGLTIRNNALYLSNTVTNLTAADNGSSNTIYHSIWGIDKDDRSWFCVEGYTNPNGTVAAFLGVRNYNTSGTAQSWKGITITEAKDNTLTYTVSDPASFRSAISSPAMTTETYPALLPIGGTNNWIKVGTSNTSYGLLPSQGGTLTNGHNYLGTSSWYWRYAYIDNIYTNYIQIENVFDANASDNSRMYLSAKNIFIRWHDGVDWNNAVALGIENGKGELILNPASGGLSTTMYLNSERLKFDSAYDHGIIINRYNATDYNLIRNHNNGNISISASSAGLYLGYENTTSINFLNGKATIESTGNFSTINASSAAWIRACSSTTGNRIFIQANTDGTVELGSAGANNTQYGILKRSNNSNAITAYGTWSFTSGLYCTNGYDIVLKAASESTDAGDIVFQNGSGTEIGRIWSVTTGGLNFRADGTNGTVMQLLPTGVTVGTISFNKSGYINVTNSGGAAWVQARNADGGNSIYIQAETAGTATLGSRCANGTTYTILQRANNSSWITAMNNWSFSNYVFCETGLILRNTGVTKGTNPSAETNRAIVFTDKDGYTSAQNDVLTMIYGGGLTAAGQSYSIIRQFQNTTTASKYIQFALNYLANGTAYAQVSGGYFETSGDIFSTVSSGEAHVTARTSSSGGNRIMIWANSSSGGCGLYSYGANGTAYDIIRRANNAHTITAYGSWTFSGTLTCNNYAGNPSIPVVSASTDGNRVATIEATNNTTMRVRGQWGTTGTTYNYRSMTVSSSDIRLKKKIKDSVVLALPIINLIKMREFDWIDGEHQVIGFIADELEKIDKKLSIGGGYDKDGSMNIKSVNTFYLQGYIVKSIQELTTISDTHEDRLTKLENENKQLKKKITMLENQLKGA